MAPSEEALLGNGRPPPLERRQRDIESAVVAMYSDHPSPGHRDKLAFAARRMKLRQWCCGVCPEDYVGREVLDAGCGTGEYACWFASQGANVTGIDLSKGSLDEARSYAASAGLRNVRFELRSVLATDLDDESFDFVYCTGVLHHTPDPIAGFKELCRVLRPGGKVLISLYNVLGFMPREVRRRVARLLGGDDLGKRITWGSRLFPFTARRLRRGKENTDDPESALYDYFAIPHETLHSIGEVLSWFDRCGIDYLGTFPPAKLGDYPAMFSAPEYASVEKRFQSPVSRLVARFGQGDLRRRRPGWLARKQVQLL